MTFKALEVHLNGKKLYTVGHEDWHALHAFVLAHRWHPDTISDEHWPANEPKPTEPIENVHLRCSLAIPGDRSDRGHHDTESYDSHQLKVGDEVTIKVVDTTEADKSNGPQQSGPTQVVQKERPQ